MTRANGDAARLSLNLTRSRRLQSIQLRCGWRQILILAAGMSDSKLEETKRAGGSFVNNVPLRKSNALRRHEDLESSSWTQSSHPIKRCSIAERWLDFSAETREHGADATTLVLIRTPVHYCWRRKMSEFLDEHPQA